MDEQLTLDQIEQKNQQHYEKLKKLKSGIEALQKKAPQKKVANESQALSFANKFRQPEESFPNKIEKEYVMEGKVRGRSNKQKNEQELVGKSNLWNQIKHSQSNTFSKNESQVSNLSSISNINNLLNSHNMLHNHNLSNNNNFTANNDFRITTVPTKTSKFDTEIEELIHRSKKNLNSVPHTLFIKHIDQKQANQHLNSHYLQNQSLKESNIHQDINKILNKVNQNNESAYKSNEITRNAYKYEKSEQIQRSVVVKNKLAAQKDENPQINQKYKGKFPPLISEISSGNSDYTNSYRGTNYEESGRSSNNSNNHNLSKRQVVSSTEIQKQFLKESLLEKKKIETEMSDFNDKESIHFQLSDDSQSQEHSMSVQHNKQAKNFNLETLLIQKQALERELQEIEEEMTSLQNQQ